jgi:putative membrane protein
VTETDPDSRARTHLANERTFLAWFRTGVTLIALGLAAAQLLGRPGDPNAELVRAVSTLVIVAGSGSVVVGLVRYRAARRQIDVQGFAPAWASITGAAVAGVVMAALALLLVWLLPR